MAKRPLGFTAADVVLIQRGIDRREARTASLLTTRYDTKEPR